MIHQRFYLNVVIRVTAITLTSLVLAYAIFKLDDLYVAINVLLLLIIQVFLLFHYVNRINRDLTHFFSAISNDDTTVVYKNTASGKSFEKLYELFDQTNFRIQHLKMENSRRTFYLQHLVDNAGIGILSYAESGKIDILNPAARKLLDLTSSTGIQHIDELDKPLVATFKKIKSGEQRLLKTMLKNDPLPLSIKASDFTFRGETIRLLTFHSIKNELEENELVSWQKLIRTLTHEIVNSIGPISSTIKTIRSFYEKDTVEYEQESTILPKEVLIDTMRGLDIIDDRAQGMLDFVNKFRSLTTPPSVSFSSVNVKDLLRGIERLFFSEIENSKINLSVVVYPESLCVTADKQLIEQVLINLVTNAIQALSEISGKSIRMAAFSDFTGKVWIQVIDNGKGISDEISDKVFVPFFTTKEKGSGIGLSLSRQIMRLHNGKISFTSVPGIETVFTLIF
jgi:nitrogen fixation/metabolism regulation signal transduction histidine kinase